MPGHVTTDELQTVNGKTRESSLPTSHAALRSLPKVNPRHFSINTKKAPIERKRERRTPELEQCNTTSALQRGQVAAKVTVPYKEKVTEHAHRVSPNL